MPKISVGESFTVALNSGIEKVSIKEGGVSTVSVENFLSHSAENFRSGEHFSVSLVSVSKSFMRHRLMSRFSIFSQKFLSHSADRFRS